MIIIASYFPSIIDLALPTRLIFLVMREVLCDGFDLACSIPVTKRDMTHICIIAIKDKKIGFIHV